MRRRRASSESAVADRVRDVRALLAVVDILERPQREVEPGGVCHELCMRAPLDERAALTRR